MYSIPVFLIFAGLGLIDYEIFKFLFNAMGWWGCGSWLIINGYAIGYLMDAYNKKCKNND